MKHEEGNVTAVINMIRDAEQHEKDMGQHRLNAQAFYNGDSESVPFDKGRSELVSRDVRDHIKKALPSIMRTLLGSDKVVEFQPTGPGDEASAQQASDYINHVVLGRIDGHKIIFDAVHDALLLRNGILKAWIDERTEIKVSEHRGLSEDELLTLAGEEGVEVLEYGPEGEPIVFPGGQSFQLYHIKIKRSEKISEVKASAVPRERFLIHPDAETVASSLLTGEREELRRSDLVAMGYDKDKVFELPTQEESETEEIARRGHVDQFDEAVRANDPITYWEVYVRVDMDGDGISELRRMCFGGQLTSDCLLDNEEVDEIPYADLTAMPQPHQWEGLSFFDDLWDVQQARTRFLRQTADNINWANNPQPVVDASKVLNMEAVMNPKFGQPIEFEGGADVRQTIQWYQPPVVANHSITMLEYLSGIGEDRSGVTDAASGLDPSALQNMTATASAMVNQGGIGQAELMVRNLAHGLQRFFKILLRMIVRHQDKEEIIRLRGEWVQVNPVHWDADMDVTVNVGLGAGTRERDMQTMQMVMQVQRQLIEGFGPNNPFVKPENLWNTLSRMVEAAGLKTPEMYFTKPEPQEVQKLLEQQGQGAKREAEMAQQEMQMKAQEAQAKIQLEQAKAAGAQAKEKAQMEADLIVEDKRIQADMVRQRAELEAKAALQQQEIAFEREQHDDKMRLEWAQLQGHGLMNGVII